MRGVLKSFWPSWRINLEIVFGAAQIFGLLLAGALISAGQAPLALISSKPDDPINAVGLLVYILAVTALMLLVLHFVKPQKKWFIKLVEILAIFGVAWLVLGVVLNDDGLGLTLALIVSAIRIVSPQIKLVRNIAGILAAAGAGAIIGVSLGWFSTLLLAALLAVYDIIAVFRTKHMVTLAKALVEEQAAFTVALPDAMRSFELGTGDLVIPVAVTSATVAHIYATGSTMTPLVAGVTVGVISLLALAGIMATLSYALQKPKAAWPALPMQVVLMTMGSGALWLLGVL